MDTYGQILIDHKRELYGSTETVRLEGGPVYRVGRMYMDHVQGDRFQLGPYRFRILPDDWRWCDNVDCVLDQPRYLPLWVQAHVHNWWRTWFTPKVVLTLVVWGLAQRPREGEIIGWHLVRRK